VIDLHSHLLPGVDDGSKSVEQSVRVLGAMRDAGVTAVCLTPHHSVGRLAKGLPASHDPAFAALSAAAPREIVLHRGVELMLDRPVPPNIGDLPGITLGGTRHILVEFTSQVAIPAVANALHQIVQAGLVPVLAHPERYRAASPQAVAQWKAVGALMQVDATTLLGGRGRGQRARDILAYGLADIIAADNHGDSRLIGTGYRFLCEAGGSSQADLLARKNPAAILAGEPVDPVPPLAIKTGLLDKLKQLLGPEE
jgi:protein-tyrosine phosphatase